MIISSVSARRVALILATSVTLASAGCALSPVKNSSNHSVATAQPGTGQSAANLTQKVNQSYDTRFSKPETSAPNSQPTAR